MNRWWWPIFDPDLLEANVKRCKTCHIGPDSPDPGRELVKVGPNEWYCRLHLQSAIDEKERTERLKQAGRIFSKG